MAARSCGCWGLWSLVMSRVSAGMGNAETSGPPGTAGNYRRVSDTQAGGGRREAHRLTSAPCSFCMLSDPPQNKTQAM